MEKIEYVPLGTLITQAKNIRCGENHYPVLSMTMHNGLVLQENKFKKEVASKNKSDYKVVFRNQLVISFPIDEGVLASQRIVDAGIVSPAYGIWDIAQEQILPEFLELALRSERSLNYYKAKLRGSTARRRTLPTATLLDLIVPLPSILEQQHILDIIHKAQAIIKYQKKELELLDELVRARFVEMFGDPIVNDKFLPMRNLSSLSILKAGKAIKTGELVDEQTNYLYPCYGGNGIRGYINRYSNEGELPIIGRQGAWAGNVNFASGKFYATEHAIVATPIIDLNTVWYYYALKLLDLTRFQTGAAQPGLAVDKLKKIDMPFPPIELQNQFADFVRETDKSRLKIQKSLESTQELFDSLMQKYFG